MIPENVSEPCLKYLEKPKTRKRAKEHRKVGKVRALYFCA